MSRKIPKHFNSRIIEDFLEGYNFAENTKSLYRSNLKKYFEFLNVDSDTYFEKDRNYKEDVLSFARSLNDRPPLSIKCNLNSVKQFLSEYDVELKSKIWRNIRNRGRRYRPITENRIPTNEELKRILQHGSIKARALFLVLSSSGMRIGEATKITWDDIDFKTRKITIKAGYTKTDNSRYTFISEEALDALIEWKKNINKYHKNKEKKSWYYRKSLNEKNIIKYYNQIFPFCEDTARFMWNNLLNKAGKPLNRRDPITKRYIYHLHTLRKFFSTRLKINKMPNDMVERLMGHEEKYHGAYNGFTEEELHKSYDEHSSCLSVFSDRRKINDIVESKLQEQNTAISSLVSKNKDLNDEMEILRVELSKIKFYYKNVAGMIDPEALDKIDKENEKITAEEFLKYEKNEVPMNID